ncbi:pitrilysin family protein [Synechocystis sp. LKSZ1]|uniref:M16 family metallopeptidase n=1 Tax=Synechocystis sp. LKSZ1 TaxID=3144951 RepID=UPI00336BE1B5
MTASLLPAALNHPTVHTFPNGLTIIAEQMPVEAVALDLWLRIGSVLEADCINGMAHFLEHMVFKGTPNLGSGAFERAIEERGAVTNAATSQDYTHYYITTAPHDFATLAPLQFEVVLNPSIAPEAFERERLVVLEEIRRSQDNPQRRIFQQVLNLGFPQSPYQRPVLGTQEIIEQLTPLQMQDFHAHWYQPGAMTAVVVGNLPPEDLIQTVAAGFARAYAVKSPTQVLPTPDIPALTSFTDIVTQEVVDESLHQARLILLWRVPSLDQLTETDALDVLAAILGRGRVSRLFRELREEKKLVSAISASNLTQAGQGLFYVVAQLPEENLAVVEALILAQMQALQDGGITGAELGRVQTQVANRFIFGNERPGDRAGLYGYYHSQLQQLAPALIYPQRIRELTAEQLQQAAQAYLSPEAYGRVIVRPQVNLPV